MEVKLTLNLPKQSDASREAVKQAVAKRSKARETVEDAFERVGQLKFGEKERELYELAKHAYSSGTISRLSDGTLTKSEVLAMGAKVQRENESAARQRRISETLRTRPENYHIITDESELPQMIVRLREEIRLQQQDEWFREVFELFNNTLIRRKLSERGIDIPAAVSLTVWDTETSGVDTRIDLTGGYSLWLPLLNEGYYVAYGHLTGEKQCRRSVALEAIRQFMESPRQIKSFHNAEFDLAMFRNDGIDAKGVRFDSMDAQNILNDHEDSYGLKPLFTRYKQMIGGAALEMDDFTFEDLFDKGSPMVYEIEVVGIYAIKDVHKGWLLTKWQIDMLRKRDDLHVPYFEIRQYLTEVNVTIERTGFEIDLDELATLGVEYRKRLEQARVDLFQAYNIDDAFLLDMSMTIKGDKIREWIEKQTQRIAKQSEMLSKCRTELSTANPTTKKYAQLKERVQRYETEKLAEPNPQNAPDYIAEFNISSNDHIAYLIYDHLGIKDRTKEIVKDKKKVRAVSNDVLQRYFDEEESLKPLAEYAKFDKLLGTYVDKIPYALDVDGRLHTQLKTVSTGRYGSSGYSGKPNELMPEDVRDSNFLDTMRRLVECETKVPKGTNLQNIPSRNEEGLRVRRTFKPREGSVFLGSDLSAIEPRIQAHRMAAEFGDYVFAEMFRKKLDPYVEFASILFEVSKEVCYEAYYKSVKGTPNAVPPYRKLMKQLFLAEGYGQAFEQFYKSVQPYGVSEEQARRAYAKFDEVLPGFKRMVETTFEHLRSHGWVATLWGQKRRFPEYVAQWKRLCQLMRKVRISDKNDPELGKKSSKLKWEERSEFWQLIKATGRAERQAFNHTIQGSGANVLQLCMIRSYYELTLARGWEFNLTLHDEQKHSVPLDQLTEEAIALYDDIMTNTVTLETPLECDTVIEINWMSEYAAEDWDFENGKPKGDV
ncbi:DNA polymerase [Paenibacillus sp. ACRRX]|uniref:DNA polymerase n=1 Tax=Paenibacillus sp. ACRRX TaxID=2918206 RepID=UPI001EF595EE|nr:DNA polymerase [Paenibacillus sp. ACRRX]MCG7407732.1 DNA polymerase [Paenibacillus sp. ACRRX]